MNTFDVCAATPRQLHEATMCLDELSKDLEGSLDPIEAAGRECPTLDCTTLVTRHAINLEVRAHDCDSELGRLFDGVIASKDLTTIWAHADARQRGIHRATISWKSTVGALRGRLSGVSNVGTHRAPVFTQCQTCDERGVMEGELCARLMRSSDPKLSGAQVFAAYRLRFDPMKDGGRGSLSGSLEGVVVRTCGPDGDCLQFAVDGTAANPRVVGPLTIQTSDLGGPTADTAVVTWGSVTGLHLWFTSVLTFATPVSAVDLVLSHLAQPATATAFDARGNAVARATMGPAQGTPQVLTLAGAGIVRVEIDAPSDETLLSSVCWRA